nr:Ldh family oxidoreductase [Bordetella bronchiseptica]
MAGCGAICRGGLHRHHHRECGCQDGAVRGNTPVYGTNPLAFAAPRKGHSPLVFDLATSAVAFGEIRLAAQHGESLPQGYGLDAQGQPTTSPEAIIAGGSLLPFGAHKGSALAMMVELLSAALTDGAFSSEIDQSSHPGAQTSRAGQTVILIDASKSAGGDFSDRTQLLCEMLNAAGQTRLPSDRRYANRAASERDGMHIDEKTYRTLSALM